MSASGVRVAASQFPVTGDVESNRAHIAQHLEEAAAAGARVLLTCEAALTGYGGADVMSWEGFDRSALQAATRDLQDRAARHRITLILGSAHFLVDPGAEGPLPTNCLYVIDEGGAIVDRYDKSMLTDVDVHHYTAGQHRVRLDLGGVSCGLLVCYDICYPEMYAVYRAMGVTLMLHAFYNAGFPGPNVLDEIKPAWLRARAADNQMWIVAANSSRPHSSWGNKVVRPDGSVADELPAGVPGLLLHDFPDDEVPGWLHNFQPLHLAADQPLHRGPVTDHPRYLDRRSPP